MMPASQAILRTVSGPSGVPPSRPPIRVPGRVRSLRSFKPMVTRTVDFTPAGTTRPHTTVPRGGAAASVSVSGDAAVSDVVAVVVFLLIHLSPGERISVRDLIEAALIQSANDAADALAFYVGHGSETRFVAMMNAKDARMMEKWIGAFSPPARPLSVSRAIKMLSSISAVSE